VLFLRLLGFAETYTKDGFLIVKPYIKNVLRSLGSSVLDNSGKKIGIVTDVIGLVDDPRLVVKLYSRELGEQLVNKRERLYFERKTKTSRK
jgi:RNA-binding protein